MNDPILVFGAGGQLGRETIELAAQRGISAVGLNRDEADITDAVAVAQAVAQIKPRLILNAAAYTAVDKAESDVAAARAINAIGPENLAHVSAVTQIPLVHISTDYVFDGSKAGAYVETDRIAPLGVYGASKAEGEARVRSGTPHHIILRTAWVYGRHGGNFLKTMLRLARERDQLRVVADQRGCPTATSDIAEAVFAIDAALAAGRKPWGLYHFAGTGVTTWHQFAEHIIAAQAAVTGRRPSVAAISTADYPTPARRPANSELDSSLFVATFGYRALPWQTRTQQAVAALLAQKEAVG